MRIRTSVSRMNAGMLQKKCEEELQYEKAMKAYVGREASNLNSGKPFPNRDELYD